VPIRDPDLDSFLAVSRARLAPRTVDSYRRDLEDFAHRLGRGIADATTEEIEIYLAELRASGLTSSTLARRLAALRSFYRHQALIGARQDNPAAGIASPRRSRTLPRTLSPGEVERLIEAAPACGSARRSGWSGPPSTSTSGSSAASARAARNGSSRSAGAPPRRCTATSSAAGRSSTAATGRSCSSTHAAARSPGPARS